MAFMRLEERGERSLAEARAERAFGGDYGKQGAIDRCRGGGVLKVCTHLQCAVVDCSLVVAKINRKEGRQLSKRKMPTTGGGLRGYARCCISVWERAFVPDCCRSLGCWGR